MTSSNNIHIIKHDNDQFIGDDSKHYLHPDSFSSFNAIYRAYYYPKKSWIGFTPRDTSVAKIICKKYGNTHTGYKIHIAIRKDEEYEKHLKNVIEILKKYGFYFKIDCRLTNEKSGERAFTIYLPHQYHAHWFEALKLVDKYLSSELAHQKMPKEYSSDNTAKIMTGFKYIRYRNDRGPGGQYTRNAFDNACERSLNNPFRPSIVSLLHEIYDHDIELYKCIANQMHNDIVYCDFLVKLHQRNIDFMNLARRLVRNPELHRMVTDLCKHEVTHEKNNHFEITEKLVKNPGQFKTISSALSNKAACPAYHASTDALNKFRESNPDIRIEREATIIGNKIKSITVKALYAKLCENKPFNEHIAQQNISTEINTRLGDNDKLTVDKSPGQCLKATLLNILHIVPIIGWAVGAYKHSQTGSFFYSFKKKTKPHKKIENDFTAAISSHNILNLK